MIHFLSLLVLFLTVSIAKAAAIDGSFAVDGPGSQTCASFVEALENQDAQASVAFAAWSQGFITAVNVYEDDTYDITPWQTPELLMAKLNGYCQANPEVPFVNALGSLIATLKADRLMSSSNLVQPRAGGKAVILPAEVLERVRNILEQDEAGELKTPEGGFDDEFSERLRRFQALNGLSQTGLPDQNTLNRLFP